jgi:hypothetical protein
VQWYGQGLDAIFSAPTIIGVGEAGPERVTVTPLGRGGGEGGGGETHYHYDLNYVAQRREPGHQDAATTMRELELYARLHA